MVEWRDFPTGRREWLAADGNWYPEHLAPGVPQVPPPTWVPPPRRGRGGRSWLIVMVTVVVVLVLVGGGLLAHSLTRQTTPPAVAGAIPGTTITGSQLNSQVGNQLATTGTDGFHVHGIGSVRCDPPHRWTSGATFGCYVYDQSGQVMGQYLATVQPSSAKGTPEWTGKWIAGVTSGSSSTSSTTNS